MLCQFLVLAGKRFWFNFGSNTYLLIRVQYSCGGALVFCLQWEIVFGVLHILSVQYSWAVVSVFWSQFLVLAITTGKKKVTVVCLAGCVVVSVFGSGGKFAIYLL